MRKVFLSILLAGICALQVNANPVLKVASTSDGHVDLGKLVSKFVQKNKCSGLTVEFEAGKTYRVERLKLPQLEEITLVGATDANGEKTQLVLSSILFTSSVKSLAFKNVCIDGNDTRFLMAWDGDLYAQSLSFTGCEVKNINQSVVRIGKNGIGMSIKDITFDNCILSELSTVGWGVVNVSSDVAALERIAFTNSTLINTGDQLLDLQGGIGQITVENCTFYNAADAKKDLSRVFLLRKTNDTPASPATLTVRNVIFAGNNAGKPMSAGLGNYKCLNFSDNNYITSDLAEGKVPFTGITRLEFAADKFFVNPNEGDFHIKAKFAGKAGDPRWY